LSFPLFYEKQKLPEQIKRFGQVENSIVVELFQALLHIETKSNQGVHNY